MEVPITIRLQDAGDGWFTSTIAEFPEAISQGASRQEAIDNVLQALKDMIEYRKRWAESGSAYEEVTTQLKTAKRNGG